jgi:hypothetical protein
MDSLAFLGRLRNGTTSPAGWLSSLVGAKALIAAWDDPLPVMVGLKRGIKRLTDRK